AERIRALGLKAPMNYISMQDISVLEPFTGETPSASELVETLARDNDTISRRLMAGIKAASEEGDPATEDMFTERLRAHQKAAWMLRAMVEQK
ncbi:MAG: ferritin-like domain-containing protein, partial [Pseudomonadota bacterium]